MHQSALPQDGGHDGAHANASTVAASQQMVVATATAPLSPSLERTFRGHRGPVTAAAFHPNLQQVASSSLDGSVMIWNYKTTMRAFRYVGHRGAVNSVDFNRAGNVVASGSADTTVRFWIPTVKGESCCIKAHAASVRSVRFSADGQQLVTGSDDKSVKLWSTATQRFEQSFTGHQNWVRTVDISADGRLVASGGDDKAVYIWDTASRKETHALFDHTDAVTSVAFHPDAHCLAAGSHDRSINVWDLRMNALLQHYAAHAAPVTSLSFHPSGDWLLSGSMDGTARLWDVREGFLYCTLNGHEGAVLGAQYSPCGTQFATSGHDGLVLVWNSHTKAPARASQGRYVDPTNTILSPLPSNRLVGHTNNSNGPNDHRPTSARGVAEGKQLAHPQQAAAEKRLATATPRQLSGTLPPFAAASTAKHSSAHPHRPRASGPDDSGAGTNIAAAVQPEVPIEQMVRQVDITAQTQKIIETRLTHQEAYQRTMVDSMRDRDVRVAQQVEVLRQQLAAVSEEGVEQRREMSRLREAVSAQGDMIKQLLDQQRDFFAQLGATASHGSATLSSSSSA